MMQNLIRLAVSWSALAVCAASLASGVLPAGSAAQEIDLSVEPTLRADVKMRDGAHLATYVWLPREGTKHAALLVRSPYGLHYGPEKDTFKRYKFKAYVDHGYALVFQDTRGTGKSEGTFSLYLADGLDGYDTVEWIAKQPWSNGRVGTDGVSYLGAVQWLAARERPPHLKCIAPTAPSGEYFEELPYIGGAFRLEWALPYMSHVLKLDTEGLDWQNVFHYRPLNTADARFLKKIVQYREWLRHPTLDSYWKRLYFEGTDFASIQVPFLTVTGWFDADQPGTLHYWHGMEATGHSQGSLIIGPWEHTQTYLGGEEKLGLMSFSKSSVIDIQRERIAFFDRCLNGDTQEPPPPRVRVFITGTNEWRSFDEYPPRAVKQVAYYYTSNRGANSRRGDGALVSTRPSTVRTDRFVFDPRQPVTYPSGVADMGALEQREDVLVYSSGPLRESLTILGPITAELYAATDGRDTDWVVSLADVYPDGTSVGLNEGGGILRARYRHGFTQEKLLKPGAVEKYSIKVWDLGHTFLPGHQLRVYVTSSRYPLVNPNQNTGNPVASDVEWHTAKQTIFLGGNKASHILLPVLKE
ncbi:MAG TPA: CocE/NonD family hydrolase [Steroidobacteraceae bacterium]